jgi:hypothetical protein
MNDQLRPEPDDDKIFARVRRALKRCWASLPEW